MPRNSDLVSFKQRKEISQLRRGRFFTLRMVFVALLVAIVIAVVSGSVVRRGPAVGLQDARQALSRSGLVWAGELIALQFSCEQWLAKHGTQFEYNLFESLSRLVFRSASAFRSERDNLSLPSRIGVSASFAVLRVAFIVLACFRLWLAALVIALVWSFFFWRPYQERDLLGETGNDRVFYSGIRVGLDDVDGQGSPRLQVTGLACPPAVSETQVVHSELGRLLKDYGVDSKTNNSLAAVIVAHQHFPAYVAERGLEKELELSFAGADLSSNTSNLLRVILDTHSALKGSGSSQIPTEVVFQAGTPLTSQQNSLRLRNAVLRVLTPTMKECLAELSSNLLTTLILSFEAGKSLAYGFEGGRWIRTSNFLQLCARSVLHSIPSFSDDYSVTERTCLRRSLVYASRRSVFAPVRLPVNLDMATRTLRQLGELLMACPHELEAVSDEVELAGLSAEAHSSWCQVLLEGVTSRLPQVVNGVYAGASNIMFIPLAQVVGVLRGVISAPVRERIEMLVRVVSERQVSAQMADRPSEENVERQAPGVPGIILPLLSDSEIEALAREHRLKSEDLRDWSALRSVLNRFGWLARRVGDYTVANSSVIYGVFQVELPDPEANEHGLVGKPGMVALRATRLVERFGRNWTGFFKEIQTANMAENAEDFARLLRGAKRRVDEEIEASMA